MVDSDVEGKQNLRPFDILPDNVLHPPDEFLPPDGVVRERQFPAPELEQVRKIGLRDERHAC